jgi:hypothetical protein
MCKSLALIICACDTTICSNSGEYGMGTMANELSLGCDCLGQIHYMVGVILNSEHELTCNSRALMLPMTEVRLSLRT